MAQPTGPYAVQVIWGKDQIINGWLPEEFSFEVQSDWGTPFADGGDKITAIASGLGVNLRLKIRSSQIWEGSSPVTLTIPIDFVAREDGKALEQVVTPVKQLMALALPDEFGEDAGTRLVPPGPNFVGTYLNKEGKEEQVTVAGTDITVRLGNFVSFKKVIVTNVSATFSGKMLRDGYPAEAKAEMSFVTYTVMTKAGLDDVFPGSGRQVSQAGESRQKNVYVDTAERLRDVGYAFFGNIGNRDRS